MDAGDQGTRRDKPRHGRHQNRAVRSVRVRCKGPASTKPKANPAPMIRATLGGLVLVMTVLTLGGHGPSSPIERAGDALAGKGHSVAQRAEADSVTAALAVVTADPGTRLTYGRSSVRTVSKNGKGSLNLSSAQLRRPPSGSLMAPLENLVPSSPFGVRTSPLTGAAGEFHWGQDYAAPCGTRVYSADAGVVRAVGWHQWGGGNRIEIDHGNGLITTYNHLEAIAAKTGDSVEVGEVIARVGTTGSSTGCHLHFETIHYGSHENPLNWALIPIKQVDELANIEMVSYSPDSGSTTSDTGLPDWAVPVSGSHLHSVDGEHDDVADASGAEAVAPAPTSPGHSGPPEPTAPARTDTGPPNPGPAPSTPSPAPPTATSEPTGVPEPTPDPVPSSSATDAPTTAETSTPTPTPSPT